MRTIEQTGQFKRDYKRETKGPHRQVLIYRKPDEAVLQLVRLGSHSQLGL